MGEVVAYIVASAPGLITSLSDRLAEAAVDPALSLPRVEVGGHLFDFPWDLVRLNGEMIRRDFPRHIRGVEKQESAGHSSCIIGPPEQLAVMPGARIEPLAVIDTTAGPVLIDHDAVVQSFSRLEGPCYIGPGSRILGANVRGSSIGPCCRIGGEVEGSIFQGYANKAHEGFLGHSYVGEWVNLGAGTQVSDLRNDYAPVRVGIAGEDVDTGLLKVGAFLGDHTKTGLGTLLNSGTVVGAFCHLLPWTTLLPKVIPSYCAFWLGQLQEQTDFRRLFGTAATVLRRRGALWTDRHAEFFLALFEQTARQRRAVLCPDSLQRMQRSALR